MNFETKPNPMNVFGTDEDVEIYSITEQDNDLYTVESLNFDEFIEIVSKLHYHNSHH